jgi:hypothetical protein
MQQLILSVDSEIGWTLSNFPGNDFFKKNRRSESEIWYLKFEILR